MAVGATPLATVISDAPDCMSKGKAHKKRGRSLSLAPLPV